MNYNKRAGSLYEQMFITEAMFRGIDISTTIGDYSPYDCIIDNGKKLLRIQVKGTASPQRSGYKVTVAKGNSMGQKIPRGPNCFDYLAAVVMTGADSHWYIVPESKIANQMSVKFFPSPLSKAKFEKYKHGWDLIC